MIKKSLIFLLVAVMLLSACSAQGSADDDKAAILAVMKEYAASLDASDVDRWGSLWTENGVQMPPGAPVNVGKAKIVSGLAGAMESFAFSGMEIDNDEMEVAGDWAYARGQYTVTYVPHDGSDPIFVDGKYMTIFQKQEDGTWKIHRDIFNSNVSP